MKKIKENLGIIVVGAIVLFLGGVLLFSDDSSSVVDENNDEESGVVDNNDTSNDKEDLIEVDAIKFSELINGDEYSILYVMSTGCGYCEQFSPILNQVVKENDLTVYYIDLSKISTTEEQNAFYNAHDYFMTGIGTPTTVIVKGGALYGVLSGYVEKETLVSFLQRHEIM